MQNSVYEEIYSREACGPQSKSEKKGLAFLFHANKTGCLVLPALFRLAASIDQ